MASVIDDILFVVVGAVLLVVAWTIYATLNTDVMPAADAAMLTLALFIAAASIALRGVFGLVAGDE